MISGGLQIGNAEIKDNNSIRQHRLGQLGWTADGRAFRYCRNGAATGAAGKLYSAMDVVSNNSTLAVAATAAIGAKKVQVTLGGSALTADQYKDGYMIAHDGTGEGYLYQIRGNQAQSTTTGTAWIYLYDAIEVALTTSSEVTLEYSPWDLVLLSSTDQADLPVGIMHSPLTINYYGWIQVGGPAACLMDEAIAVGDMCTTGSSVQGALEMHDAVGEPLVGQTLTLGVDTEYSLVNLLMY